MDLSRSEVLRDEPEFTKSRFWIIQYLYRILLFLGLSRIHKNYILDNPILPPLPPPLALLGQHIQSWINSRFYRIYILGKNYQKVRSPIQKLLENH